jgi:hypothetical protein
VDKVVWSQSGHAQLTVWLVPRGNQLKEVDLSAITGYVRIPYTQACKLGLSSHASATVLHRPVEDFLLLWSEL